MGISKEIKDVVTKVYYNNSHTLNEAPQFIYYYTFVLFLWALPRCFLKSLE